MLDALALINKHKAKGVLVDTNLLVLLLVGAVNKQRIPTFKRTGDFSIEEYELLVRLIDWFGKLIATPHVLSQVSDLTDLSGKELTAIRERFKVLVVQDIEESYDASRVLVDDPTFIRFGLADAAIATACSRGILVLTTDLQLQLALQALNIDALNFNHIRALAW
jgi:predicted nucleic acid-binding protein